MEDIAYEHWFGGGHHRLNGRSYLFGAREHHGYRECSREPAVHNQQWNTKLVGQCEWDGYIDVPIVRVCPPFANSQRMSHPPALQPGSQIPRLIHLVYIQTHFIPNQLPARSAIGCARQDALTYVMGLNVHQADEW